MKKIWTALAVLAVIAAGTAAALIQQLQPEEYESVDAAVGEHKREVDCIYQTLGVGEDFIVVLYHAENDTYSMLDIRKSGDGYILKEETTPIHSKLGFSQSFRYSKKESVTVTLSPDENGTMQCTLSSAAKG